jgi:hypothetical protein
MRPNRNESESAPFWFQSLSSEVRPHGGLPHQQVAVQEVSFLSREALPAPSNINASEQAISNNAHW